ncbi:hypothetical protein CAPTEDRAFT_205136 [Capitella teleta]|uniref:Uncharacterized protein n=1 Tax=Capitella teleta TaxID=283909 RepID=R7TT56_CAPTE|nr:hypothetical protein CAPTEDRAFT_205136 [Capitella teleta]|eukprot:ELT96804.1 hypothetical protein CAPTEDRAFT_205136 [Capitella teleta]
MDRQHKETIVCFAKMRRSGGRRRGQQDVLLDWCPALIVIIMIELNQLRIYKHLDIDCSQFETIVRSQPSTEETMPLRDPATIRREVFALSMIPGLPEGIRRLFRHLSGRGQVLFDRAPHLCFR